MSHPNLPEDVSDGDVLHGEDIGDMNEQINALDLEAASDRSTQDTRDDAQDVTLASKVDKTATIGRLYGTDGSGVQTTYPLNSSPTANTVALRGAGGVVRTGTPATAGDAVPYVAQGTKIVEYVGAQNLTNQAIPVGAIAVRLTLIGGGHGGGSGRRGAAGSACYGGGGGAAGPCIRDLFIPVPVGVTTFDIKIGAGAAGAAAIATNDTNGLAATAFPSVSQFRFGSGSYVTTSGSSTFMGGGGTAAAGNGAGGVTWSGIGGNSSITAKPTQLGTSWPENFPSGAAAGGGISAANVAFDGGDGGLQRIHDASAGGIGGVVDGSVPTAIAARSGIPGSGGGGGAASITAAAQAGADALGYGAPGGGGGASRNGFNSGRGGNGGPAYGRLEWVYV